MPVRVAAPEPRRREKILTSLAFGYDPTSAPSYSMTTHLQKAPKGGARRGVLNSSRVRPPRRASIHACPRLAAMISSSLSTCLGSGRSWRLMVSSCTTRDRAGLDAGVHLFTTPDSRDALRVGPVEGPTYFNVAAALYGDESESWWTELGDEVFGRPGVRIRVVPAEPPRANIASRLLALRDMPWCPWKDSDCSLNRPGQRSRDLIGRVSPSSAQRSTGGPG